MHIVTNSNQRSTSHLHIGHMYFYTKPLTQTCVLIIQIQQSMEEEKVHHDSHCTGQVGRLVERNVSHVKYMIPQGVKALEGRTYVVCQ